MPASLTGSHLVDAANGFPTYLGTIDCTTTSKTNHEATTAFSNTGECLLGKLLLIHNAGAVAVHIHPVATSTGTTNSSRAAGFGVPLSPGDRVAVRMGMKFMAAIAASSTANLDFWELT